jgi:hypothetical protein
MSRSVRFHSHGGDAAAAASQLLEQLLSAVTSLERHLAPDIASPGSPAVTPFHSSAVPPVPLAQYAHRIAHFSGYGAFGIQIGLALLGRFTQATGRVPTPLTAHRLLATSIIVGMKATAISSFAMTTWPKLQGSPCAN